MRISTRRPSTTRYPLNPPISPRFIAKPKLAIAADCPLGEHAFRLRTRSGISVLRTFWVGALRDIPEKENNNRFAKPQVVPLGATVNGRITREDVDFFAIDAKKGQRISVEIEGLRLATTMFDPYLAIYDQRRFVLAEADDSES